MSHSLVVRNRARGTNVKCRSLRGVIKNLLLQELKLDSFELGVYLVGSAEIIRLNEEYLQHAGPTDVITFDYREPHATNVIIGDIVVCLPQAKIQARQFKTSWPAELVRYIAHGILHLLGFDDHTASKRKRMKREEDRLVKNLVRRFDLRKVV